MTAEHGKWIESYRTARGKYNRDTKALARWAWRKVKNNIDVARRQRPHQTQATITVAARRGRRLTEKDRRVVAFVCGKLAYHGYAFDHESDTTDGLTYASVQVHSLKSIRQLALAG